MAFVVFNVSGKYFKLNDGCYKLIFAPIGSVVLEIYSQEAIMWVLGKIKGACFMPKVKDVQVIKPGPEQVEQARTWPIWQCGPSEFDWQYTQTEKCLLLEGKVTVRDEQSSVEFGPGDYVIFPEGLECVWDVHEAVKKHYTFE